MPIFEYVCGRCKREFELIVLGNRRPSCPECASVRLEKKFSGFAVGGGGSALAAVGTPCGSCGDPRGPGACDLN